MARKDRMNLSLAVTAGSSVRTARFVAPLLVLLSHVVGPQPMDLVFTPAEVVAIVVSVVITGRIAGEGESHWLEGVDLFAVQATLAPLFSTSCARPRPSQDPAASAHAGTDPLAQPRLERLVLLLDAGRQPLAEPDEVLFLALRGAAPAVQVDREQ